jgi:hypothetical protein
MLKGKSEKMTKIIDEEQKIDDMVFSEKGSQDGDINNDD